MSTATLIVNPTAGRGAAGRHIPAIQALLRSLGIETELQRTEKRGDAAAQAQRAKQRGSELVIAVGGDGTIHEAANGLARAAGDGVAGTLGIIPFGSGNDFVKMLDFRPDWESACRRIARGAPRLVDLGRIDGRYFVNNVGVGFDAQVGIEALKVPWAPGQARYIVALARNMLYSYRTSRVRVELDGREFSRSITLLTIGNGRCSGGGFYLTPDAAIDDGVFDVCIARVMSKRQILALVPAVMQGTHITNRKVQMARARRIVVTSTEPLPVHADGEIIDEAATHIEVELLPHKLALLG